MAKHKPYIYEQVRGTLVEMIASGGFKPGDRLPSERELAKRLGCNYHTVRRGLALLEQDRQIERRVGAGTFVRRLDDRDYSQRVASSVLGMICLSRMDNFAMQLLHHLHEEAERREVGLSIRTVSDLGVSAVAKADQMIKDGCSALIIPWMPYPTSVTEVVDLIRRLERPVVLSRPIGGLEHLCYEDPAFFGQSDASAVEMAYRYFVALGFGHIAMFGPDTMQNEVLSQRVLTFTRMASQHDRPSLVHLVGQRADGVDAVAGRLASTAGDVAVICYDDDHALRLMTAAHKLGLRIPQDVAVLGFNNIPLSRSSDPPLSTIQFDYDYVASAMLNHAQALASDGSRQARGGAASTLVVRESCGGRVRAGDGLEAILKDIRTGAMP